MNVVFIIFRRPDLTSQVFKKIAQARPGKLFVISDGPHSDRPGEDQKVMATRAVVEKIDWPCQVFRNYSETNMGCKNRVISGLDWVFSQVEDAIIIEDDCEPSPEFFAFCTTLLPMYRDEPRVMAINGSSFVPARLTGPHSYFFSRYPQIWGWATWKRAWDNYDPELRDWPEKKAAGWLEEKGFFPREVEFWDNMFHITHTGELNSWDFAWTYTCWRENGLSIAPAVNMITNIGCRSDGTHLFDKSPVADLPIGKLGPLSHPPRIERNEAADLWTFYRSGAYITPPTWVSRMKYRLFNRHFYGNLIKKIPFLWAAWERVKKKRQRHEKRDGNSEARSQ